MTIERRRADRALRDARMKAKHHCRCGKPMDRVGARCIRCTNNHARQCRGRYRRTGYGSGFTAILMTFSQALAQRGMQ